MNYVDIKTISNHFRDAFENMSIEFFPDSSFFSRFPSGCCGDSSHLLAKYFKDSGLSPYYVCGWKGSQSHAWIQVDNLIIDITADQFDDVSDRVILTEYSVWHSEFVVSDRYLSDFEQHNVQSAKRYGIIYENVLRWIKQNK
ncbi:hypothetical protein [Paenibacillus luteus]|uniref:hypothetical protein n=1 Tax=Paenibacillus luteus TaxID=2545753 RepID=UPI001143D841|nr:hypothetical protein [Paenibacillus luteus]